MNKERSERILSIIEDCLFLLKKQEGYLGEFANMHLWELGMHPKKSEEDIDEEDIEEEGDWEEITEDIKDNSPKSLKEEVEHLNNLIDLICETFGLEKYVTEKGALGVAWDKGLIEEIAKARKILDK